MPKIVFENISVYTTFIKNAFLKMLTYRLRYYSGILTYFLFVSVNYYIWQAVYAGKGPTTLIKGFSLTEMLTYIAVGWIARSFYFSYVDREINEIVQSGQISIYLLRPVNFQIMMLFQAMGESLFRFAFLSIPIGILIVIVFPISAPFNLTAFALFCISTLLGFIILASINFLIGLAAFALQSIHGIIHAKLAVIQLCSGLLLPLSFFPNWAQVGLSYLPFKGIAYTPILFYLGKIDAHGALLALGQQLFWALLLLFLGQLFWRRALSKLILQGG